MLNNDLSNYAAPMILFNFERVICDKVEKGWLKGYKFEVNRQNVGAVNSLFKKDLSIYYLTFIWPDKKIDELERQLEWNGCYFNGVIKVKDIPSLRMFLQVNNAQYFDTDKDILRFLGRYGAEWKGYLVQLWNGNGA